MPPSGLRSTLVRNCIRTASRRLALTGREGLVGDIGDLDAAQPALPRDRVRICEETYRSRRRSASCETLHHRFAQTYLTFARADDEVGSPSKPQPRRTIRTPSGRWRERCTSSALAHRGFKTVSARLAQRTAVTTADLPNSRTQRRSAQSSRCCAAPARPAKRDFGGSRRASERPRRSPDAYVSRGLGSLRRTAALRSNSSAASHTSGSDCSRDGR